MKEIIAVLIALNCITTFAQVPQTINFQAQARGADGKLLDGKSFKTRFSILEIVASGTPVYIESHSTTTDNSGMFNLIIGNGTVGQGNFKSINWATQPKYLKDLTGFNYGNETAYPDHFVDPYVGKVYGDNSTEVMSMGMQYFKDAESMLRLYRKDKEHFYLIVGAIRGDTKV